MTAPVLNVEEHGDGVVVITLNRPEKRNALNAELRQAVIDALKRLATDDRARVVVLCGAGSTFCAGFDLHELMAAEDAAAIFAHSTVYHHAVHTFAKPLIAAIEGAAVAGGMDLALMCDVRVAASDARFGQPQVKMGVPAAFDLIKSVVAEPVARELCLTGRTIDANEAKEVNLVHRLVEPGTTLDVALELAKQIADVAGASIMKEAFVAAQPVLFAIDDSDSR